MTLDLDETHQWLVDPALHSALTKSHTYSFHFHAWFNGILTGRQWIKDVTSSLCCSECVVRHVPCENRDITIAPTHVLLECQRNACPKNVATYISMLFNFASPRKSKQIQTNPLRTHFGTRWSAIGKKSASLHLNHFQYWRLGDVVTAYHRSAMHATLSLEVKMAVAIASN